MNLYELYLEMSIYQVKNSQKSISHVFLNNHKNQILLKFFIQNLALLNMFKNHLRQGKDMALNLQMAFSHMNII